MKKIEFIVLLEVSFGELLTGGVLALHKLSYELAKRGYKVTMFTYPEYPHANIEVIKDINLDNIDLIINNENTVIITVKEWKNNIGAKNVTRWVNYHITCDDENYIEEKDEIFNYGSFDVCGKINFKKLTVFDYKTDFFYDKKLPRNKKYCYITNKKHPDNWFDIFENQYRADNITDWKSKGYEYLAEKLNEYEFLLTYDDKSFYSLAAGMCGTKTIILSKDYESPINYKLKTPFNLFGVAYGWEDIEWAEKTINLVPMLVEHLKEDDQQTIDNFVNFWEEKING